MELKCPFSAPITTGRAACRQAIEVVRRGGAEYDCADASAHVRCAALFSRLKSVGLDAFSVEDDLTQMPHSVLVKIQGGGLQGLQRQTAVPAGGTPGSIADIDALVAAAVEDAGSVDRIPVESFATEMTNYQLERRSRRKR